MFHFAPNQTTDASRYFLTTNSTPPPHVTASTDYYYNYTKQPITSQYFPTSPPPPPPPPLSSSPLAVSVIPLQGLISKSTLKVMLKVNSTLIVLLVGLLGSVLNIVNSAVFVRQGLKDPVTITLFVLSLADFGSIITLWLRSVFYILLFFPDAAPNIDPSYLSGVFTWPHAVLVRVSCLLTVFIAFERWLCVAFPLHASRIVTVPLAKGYNCLVVACLVAMFISLFCYSQIKLVFLPQENRSLFILTLTPDGYAYASQMSTIVINVYLTTFGLLIVFTILIIVKLEKQRKWRLSVSTSTGTSASGATSSSTFTTSASRIDSQKSKKAKSNNPKLKSDPTSAKNRKVVKMVVAICLIFILSTLPSVTNTLVYLCLPGYVEMGRFYNLYQLNNQLCFTLEVVNSTCNFFIYFHMSSNFSNTLRRMLGRVKSNSQ